MSLCLSGFLLGSSKHFTIPSNVNNLKCYAIVSKGESFNFMFEKKAVFIESERDLNCNVHRRLKIGTQFYCYFKIILEFARLKATISLFPDSIYIRFVGRNYSLH